VVVFDTNIPFQLAFYALVEHGTEEGRKGGREGGREEGRKREVQERTSHGMEE